MQVWDDEHNPLQTTVQIYYSVSERVHSQSVFINTDLWSLKIGLERNIVHCWSAATYATLLIKSVDHVMNFNELQERISLLHQTAGYADLSTQQSVSFMKITRD